jgi:hypothetical protein
MRGIGVPFYPSGVGVPFGRRDPGGTIRVDLRCGIRWTGTDTLSIRLELMGVLLLLVVVLVVLVEIGQVARCNRS